MKQTTLNAKCVQTNVNTSLKDLSVILNDHGHHGFLSFFSSLAIWVFRTLEKEGNNFYYRANKSYNAALLTTFP